VVSVGSAGRKSVTFTVDGSSKTVHIHVINATPLPVNNPPAGLRHTLSGRANPGANFGLTVVTIGQQGVAGPKFDVTAHLDGNQWRFRVTEIRHRYKVGVNSQGHIDITGPGDPDVRPNTIARIITDLTPPPAGTPNGPPRTRYWSQRITRAHEQAHVDHFYADPTFWPNFMGQFENEVETATVNFNPADPTTLTARAVIKSQRTNWQARADFFHGQADAAEIPSSETFAHGQSNPMYTALLASISNAVAPPAPTNLVANPASSNSVDLTWTQDVANETGFVIQRRQGRGRFTPVGNIGPAPTSFTDTGLQPNTRYTYRVAAAGVTRNSAFSRQVTVTTPP
jgi:hypothetical protein